MNMEQLLICLSLALIAGLLMSRLAKVAHLPAVTSYLVAGLLLGPFFLGRLSLSGWGIGFGSLAQVESYGLITQVALGFIAFVIGNEFRLTTLESMGRQAITVGILQAVVTTALVDLALVVLHLLRPDVISMASAITLGAIAAATAPAATLMVVKQYKANGPLTHLLLMVVAIDDAVGLVLFSASFGVANALEQGRIDPLGVIVEPLVEIVLPLGLGAQLVQGTERETAAHQLRCRTARLLDAAAAGSQQQRTARVEQHGLLCVLQGTAALCHQHNVAALLFGGQLQLAAVQVHRHCPDLCTDLFLFCLHSLTSSAHIRFSFYHIMPARCGQAKTIYQEVFS